MNSYFPDEWIVTDIGELGGNSRATVQTGPFGAQLHADDYVDEGVPFILIRNIGHNGLTDAPMPRIKYEDAKRLAKYALEPGDIVFSRVGRIGSCFMAKPEHAGWIISGQTLRIRMPQNSIYHNFLYYVLRTEEVARYLAGSSVGSTRSSINTKILESLPIWLPTLSEQRKIAAILSSLDRCIETTEGMIAKLQDLKKALMQELLTKGLPPKVAAKYGIKKSGKFKNSPLGKIPKEWEVAKLENMCMRITDGTHDTPKPSKYGFHLVTSKNLRYGRIDIKNSYMISNRDYHEVNKRSKVDAGDVLFGMIGTVGNPVVVEERDLPFAIKNVGLFKTNGDFVLSQWLCYYLSSLAFMKFLDTQLLGSSQRFVGLGFLRELGVPRTQRKEMNIIVQVLNSIQDKINNVKKRQGITQNLKKALMQDLLTGKVRVKVDDVA